MTSPKIAIKRDCEVDHPRGRCAHPLLGMGVKLLDSTKTSPFILSSTRLTALTSASLGDPAVLDLVRSYRQALAHVNELREMLSMELEYFGV